MPRFQRSASAPPMADEVRRVVPLLALVLLLISPQAAKGQSIFDLMESIRQGGGWVQIPLKSGSGSYLSNALPTLGLTLVGCMQVYGGHSGTWDIQATDPLGEGRLEVTVVGGEPVTFRYRTGGRSQLRVDARWSEPLDATLFIWVGLETPLLRRDPCEPVYADVPGGAPPGAPLLKDRPPTE